MPPRSSWTGPRLVPTIKPTSSLLEEVEERDGSIAALGFSASRLVGFNLFGDVRRAGPLLRALGRAPRDPAADGCVSAAASLAAVREGITWM